MTLSRRKVLLSSFYLGGAAALGALGCTEPQRFDDAGVGDAGLGDAGPDAWVITGAIFVAGSDATFDLAPTLPAGTATGGVFEVDPSGSPLPSGMTLSAAGVLSVGTATAGVFDGVVFRYTSP